MKSATLASRTLSLHELVSRLRDAEQISPDDADKLLTAKALQRQLALPFRDGGMGLGDLLETVAPAFLSCLKAVNH